MSSQMKLTDFLCEKLTNMYRWLAQEFEDVRPRLESDADMMHMRQSVEWVMFISIIKNNIENIKKRDFRAIATYVLGEVGASDIFERPRVQEPEFQDKFWRYMDMFVEVISNQ